MSLLMTFLGTSLLKKIFTKNKSKASTAYKTDKNYLEVNDGKFRNRLFRRRELGPKDARANALVAGE